MDWTVKTTAVFSEDTVSFCFVMQLYDFKNERWLKFVVIGLCIVILFWYTKNK